MNLKYLLFILLMACYMGGLSYTAFVSADTQVEPIEIIRNGDFESGNVAWGFSNILNNGLGQVENGISVLDILAVDSEENFGLTFQFQPLYLPDEWSGGTVRFRHRVTRSDASTDWTEIEYVLTEDDIALIQQEQANGQQPLILFFFQTADTSSMDLWLDDVSFVVDGTPDARPDLEGTIAYLGHNVDNRRTMLKMIQPDGSAEQMVRSTINELFTLRDVAWRPDATELAYISSESLSSSYFLADLFAIRHDGTGLRRLTNYPDPSNIGDHPTGRVTGAIHTDLDDVGTIALHIQGAQSVAAGVLDIDSTLAFDLTVADLGDGVSQPIYITYEGANGIEKQLLLTTLDVLAEESVDVGTLSLDSISGVRPTAIDLAWHRDGESVGFTLREVSGSDTVQQVSATGGLFGTELVGATFVSEPALSPIDDRVLYHRTSGKGQGICLNNVGGDLDDENCLVPLNDSLGNPRPVWLNDGSGFVFSSQNNLFSYSFASQEVVQLTNAFNEAASNASVSPDGNYVAYERASTSGSDLWILDLSDSSKSWPITNDGRSSNPDWSKVAPTVPTLIQMRLWKIERRLRQRLC